AQFEELESFARLGAELDASTRSTLNRGARVREVLKQEDLEVVPVREQLVALLALNEGLFDDLPAARVAAVEKRVRRDVAAAFPELLTRLERGEPLPAEGRVALLDALRALFAQARDEGA